MYTDLKVLFEWRRAIDTKNIVWEPPKEYFELNRQFKVVELIETAYVKPGDIVFLLETDYNEDAINDQNNWLLFSKAPDRAGDSNSDYLYWCEVQPYE